MNKILKQMAWLAVSGTIIIPHMARQALACDLDEFEHLPQGVLNPSKMPVSYEAAQRAMLVSKAVFEMDQKIAGMPDLPTETDLLKKPAFVTNAHLVALMQMTATDRLNVLTAASQQGIKIEFYGPTMILLAVGMNYDQCTKLFALKTHCRQKTVGKTITFWAKTFEDEWYKSKEINLQGHGFEHIKLVLPGKDENLSKESFKKAMDLAQENFKNSQKWYGLGKIPTKSELKDTLWLSSNEQLAGLMQLNPTQRLDVLQEISQKKNYIRFEQDQMILLLQDMNTDQIQQVMDIKTNEDTFPGQVTKTIGTAIKQCVRGLGHRMLSHQENRLREEVLTGCLMQRPFIEQRSY